MNREGGHVIEASAEITDELLVVEAFGGGQDEIHPWQPSTHTLVTIRAS